MVVPCPSVALGLLETVAADLVVAVGAKRRIVREIPVLVQSTLQGRQSSREAQKDCVGLLRRLETHATPEIPSRDFVVVQQCQGGPDKPTGCRQAVADRQESYGQDWQCIGTVASLGRTLSDPGARSREIAG